MPQNQIAMYWKNKLEGLESSSTEDWEKDALWNQLNRRINKRRFKRTLLNGSIVLATCALLLGGLVWSSKDKQLAFPISNIIYKPTDTKKPAFSKKAFQKEEEIFKNETRKVNKNAVGKKPVQKKENTSPIIYFEETEKQNLEIPYEENKVNTATTADSAVASTSPLRKLRVVHINELGKPAKESPRIARTSQGSVKDRDKKSTSDFFSKNFDDNILKIKISPHN